MANEEKARHQWKVFEDVLVGISTGAGPLDDSQWEPFVQQMRSGAVKKYLQYSPGSVQLSSTQRKLGIDAAGSLDKVVMVTDSALVRGIATAASWFGVKVASFRCSQLPDAVATLNLSPGTQTTVLETIEDMVKRA